MKDFLAAWRRRFTGPTARRGVVSLVDQSLLSATNLAASVLLARHSSRDEFGAYVVALAVFLLLSGAQNAAITNPMLVLGAPKTVEVFPAYAGTMRLAQVAVSLALGAGTAAVAAVMLLLDVGGRLPAALLAMAAALPFQQLLEFSRISLLARLQPLRALALDAADCGVQLALFALLLVHARTRDLTAPQIFLCILAGAVVALIPASFLAGHLWRRPGSWAEARAFLGENWAFGRWNLGSTIGHVCLAQGNNLVVALTGGLAHAGTLEAPRLLLAPLNAVAAAGRATLTPRAAQIYAREGRHGLNRFLWIAALPWILFFVGYSAVIGLAPGFWLRVVYGDKYGDAGLILTLTAVVFALQGFREMPVRTLQVVRRPDLVMFSVLAGGLFLVVASTWASAAVGVIGAVVARIAGEIVLLCLLNINRFRVLSGSKDGAREDRA